ncbi:hypothetical protein TCAL_15254 [Tigriopus californicus]|uniref:C2H2-type domain-containing protein n=1 Tax=Tigriopus californicus TaxID=6832 RepID=A0A553NC55_TIGCA|nr:uncharacterized protein LOC131889470 [Tigriopus californicus]TRY63007.1 hypothetical protein TCAL_15254 [Tigriopus californicus]
MSADEVIFQPCPFCPTFWPDLSQHVALHPELHFQCFRCIRSNIRGTSPLFMSYYELGDHLRLEHNVFSHQMHRDTIPPLDGRQIVCLRCPTRFFARSLEAIIHHYDRCHPEEGLKFELEDISTRSYEGEFEMKCRFCDFVTNHFPKWLAHFPMTYERCVNLSQRLLDQTQPYFIDASECKAPKEYKPSPPSPEHKSGKKLIFSEDTKIDDKDTFRPNIKVTLIDKEPETRVKEGNAPDYCLACDLIIPNCEDMDKHLRSLEHQTQSVTINLLYCNICFIAFPGCNRDQFDLHLHSKEHHANLDHMVNTSNHFPFPSGSQSPKKRSRSPSPSSYPTGSLSYKKIKIAPEFNLAWHRKYLCRICERACPTAFSLQQHFLGRSHHSAMEKTKSKRFYMICSICFPLKLTVNISEFFEHVQSKRHLDRLDFLNSMEQSANVKRPTVSYNVPKSLSHYLPPSNEIPTPRFTCFFCDKLKDESRDASNHLVLSHPKELFQCKTCSLCCSSLKAMQIHFKSGHVKTKFGRDDIISIPRHFYYTLCRECEPPRKFGGANRRMVEDHLKHEHHHRKPNAHRLWVRCRLCCKDFKSVFVFDDHPCMKAFVGKSRISLVVLEAVIRNA